MSVTYNILKSENLVYVRLNGLITLADMSASLKDYVRDPDFHPDQKQIVDLRFMTDALALFWEMGEFKKLYEELYDDLSKPVDVALVTFSPLTRRLSWMYAKIMKDRRTLRLAVFHDIQPALAHFAMTPDTFELELARSRDPVIVDFQSRNVAQDVRNDT